VLNRAMPSGYLAHMIHVNSKISNRILELDSVGVYIASEKYLLFYLLPLIRFSWRNRNFYTTSLFSERESSLHCSTA